MTVMNIQFTKLSAQKTQQSAGKINVENKISVTSAESKIVALGQPTHTLVVGFGFDLLYQPNIGEISIAGTLMMMLPKEKVLQIAQDFTKTKILPVELMETVVKSVYNKCQIQGIILANEIGLPSPVPLPKINVSSKTVANSAPKKK